MTTNNSQSDRQALIARVQELQAIPRTTEWEHCPECGPCVSVDEDGSCATCGSDCTIQHGPSPAAAYEAHELAIQLAEQLQASMRETAEAREIARHFQKDDGFRVHGDFCSCGTCGLIAEDAIALLMVFWFVLTVLLCWLGVIAFIPFLREPPRPPSIPAICAFDIVVWTVLSVSLGIAIGKGAPRG